MQCPRAGFIGLSNRPLDAYGALWTPMAPSRIPYILCIR